MFKKQTSMIILLGIAALSILAACAAPTQEEPAPQPTQEPPTAVAPTRVEPAPTATPATPAESVPTSPAITGDGSAAGGASPIAGHSLRVVTFNTHLLSPIFQCGVPVVPVGDGTTLSPSPCYLLNELGETTSAHAHLIAYILDDGYFDVVALNEVWDEDDGKDVLVKTLKGVYPYRVEYVGWSGVDFEEDSGLMLFSKLPFEPLPDHTFKSEDNITHDENDSDRVAFVDFEACDDFDCWASKGAFLVRLRHPSERIINVVVTHLQADYGDTDYWGVREKQLLQIYGHPHQPTLVETTLGVPSLAYWPNEQWILVMGDLNIDGRGGVGEALYPAQSPTQEPIEWWYQFGSPAAHNSATLYDAWAETTSETDFGATNGLDPGERLDYILASRRTSEPWKGMPPDMCVQHVWIPPELESLSDHRPVAADLNLEAPQCNPRLAYEPTLEQMGVMTSAQELEATMLNGQITYPGSMQWWRLGDLGTYSIAFDPNAAAAGVRYEVYDADDLSHPLGGSHWVDKNKILVCSSPSSADPEKRGQAQRCWWAESETMVFPDDVYIRVFAEDRAWTGDYWIAFHKHACKTKKDACSLLPNNSIPFDFPEKKPLNQEDGAWFRIDIREQADTGARQDLQFSVWSREDTWIEPKVAIFDQGGVSSLSKIDGQPLAGPMVFNLAGNQPVIVYTATTSLNKVLYMRVFRNDMNQPLPIRVNWATNLTLLGGVTVGPGGVMLICNDETNPEDGNDEIALQVDIDYTGWQDRGYDTFDCNESSDERPWDILGDIRFLHQVQIRLIERDSGTDEDDESNIVVQQAWGIDTVVTDPARTGPGFDFEGGSYTIIYNVSKWRVNK